MRKVISGKNLGIRPPVLMTIVLWLVLDRIAAPGWAWGVMWSVVAMFWIVYVFDLFNRDDVEILK